MIQSSHSTLVIFIAWSLTLLLCMSKIYKRAGYSSQVVILLTILTALPVVNTLALLWVAFTPWPRDEDSASS
ncbi:MAG: hypothetical protein U0R19_07170 [Bryobacteraceae bacterium]